jgi:hypothetical protein
MKYVKIIYLTSYGAAVDFICREDKLENYLENLEIKGLEVVDFEYIE